MTLSSTSLRLGRAAMSYSGRAAEFAFVYMIAWEESVHCRLEPFRKRQANQNGPPKAAIPCSKPCIPSQHRLLVRKCMEQLPESQRGYAVLRDAMVGLHRIRDVNL